MAKPKRIYLAGTEVFFPASEHDPDRWCERATRFEATYQDYRQRRRRQAV